MTGSIATYCCLVLTVGTGLYAAWLWRASSRVSTGPYSARLGLAPFTDPKGITLDGLMGLEAGGQEAAALNAKAAVWTGISVLLSAATTVVDHLH